MEAAPRPHPANSKLAARIAAGKRHMTEAAIKKAVAPAPKPVKPLTNNPGYGYHGIADAKYKGDANKAHSEYNKMHAKVKDWAGEAGHLMHSKKPNLMVRDYLDSPRGRHLEGLQADDKYIKKDFGHFARSYDPKLFTEETLAEGKKVTHGVFVNWHAGERKGLTVHHGGNTSDPEKATKLAERLNGQLHDGKQYNYHYEARPLGRKTVNEQAGPADDNIPGIYTKQDKDGRYREFPIKKHPAHGYALHLGTGAVFHMNKSKIKQWIASSGSQYVREETLAEDHDDYSGTYEVQSRDGNYRRVHIRRQPSGKYHIHHPDGSKGEWSHDGVKSYIARNNATWMNEETLNETSKSEDAQRVQYGVMKRDDYLKKWKIGKYGERPHPLAGPGGLYKNLVGRSIDSKSAATKK